MISSRNAHAHNVIPLDTSKRNETVFTPDYSQESAPFSSVSSPPAPLGNVQPVRKMTHVVEVTNTPQSSLTPSLVAMNRRQACNLYQATQPAVGVIRRRASNLYQATQPKHNTSSLIRNRQDLPRQSTRGVEGSPPDRTFRTQEVEDDGLDKPVVPKRSLPAMNSVEMQQDSLFQQRPGDSILPEDKTIISSERGNDGDSVSETPQDIAVVSVESYEEEKQDSNKGEFDTERDSNIERASSMGQTRDLEKGQSRSVPLDDDFDPMDFDAVWSKCDVLSPNYTEEIPIECDPQVDIRRPILLQIDEERQEEPLGIVVRVLENGDSTKSSISGFSTFSEDDHFSNSPYAYIARQQREKVESTNSVPKTLKRKPLPQQNSFLEGNLSKMGSDCFGHRPQFEVSATDRRRLSLKPDRDPRKVIDKHLRILGTSIGQSLSLNTRGSCYFYYEEIFVHVRVPNNKLPEQYEKNQEHDIFVMSCTVHQFIPGKGKRVNSNEILHQVQNLERIYGSKALSITMKNRLQINLTCTKRVHPTYTEFKKCMKEFRDFALDLKDLIKTTRKTKTPYYAPQQEVEI